MPPSIPLTKILAPHYTYRFYALDLMNFHGGITKNFWFKRNAIKAYNEAVKRHAATWIMLVDNLTGETLMETDFTKKENKMPIVDGITGEFLGWTDAKSI